MQIFMTFFPSHFTSHCHNPPVLPQNYQSDDNDIWSFSLLIVTSPGKCGWQIKFSRNRTCQLGKWGQPALIPFPALKDSNTIELIWPYSILITLRSKGRSPNKITLQLINAKRRKSPSSWNILHLVYRMQNDTSMTFLLKSTFWPTPPTSKGSTLIFTLDWWK